MPDRDGARGPDRLDLMIAGAQKAGTSALLSYLGRHPGVVAQRRPELNYFVNPAVGGSSFAEVSSHYFGPTPAGGAPVVVGKLAGLMYEPSGLAKLHREQPTARAVVLLRDPIKRAFSAYLHARSKGREPLGSFEEALAAGPERFGEDTKSARICAYVDRSLYARHLRVVFEHLGRDNVDVVFLDDLTSHPRAVAATILSAWDLDPTALPEQLPHENRARTARSDNLASLRRQGGRVGRALPQAVRDRLRSVYLSVNERSTGGPVLSPKTAYRLRREFEAPNADLAGLLGLDPESVWPGAD